MGKAWILLRAPAKVNLCLDVLGRRPDGYHDLSGVMQALAVHDRVLLRRVRAADGPRMARVRLRRGVGGPVPLGGDNLAVRALRLLGEAVGRPLPVEVTVLKRLPVAAGLGGGSSDAAAALAGAVRLLDLPLSPGELAAVAARVGADVPFFLRGGACLAEGRGDRLTPLPFPGAWPVVLARPDLGVSTASVYAALEPGRLEGRPDVPGMVRALAAGDFAGVCRRLGNVLEGVTLRRHPAVAALKERFLSLGAPGCLMAGSGPTVFALARDEGQAAALAAGVADLAAWVAVTRFSPEGVTPVAAGGGDG